MWFAAENSFQNFWTESPNSSNSIFTILSLHGKTKWVHAITIIFPQCFFYVYIRTNFKSSLLLFLILKKTIEFISFHFTPYHNTSHLLSAKIVRLSYLSPTILLSGCSIHKHGATQVWDIHTYINVAILSTYVYIMIKSMLLNRFIKHNKSDTYWLCIYKYMVHICLCIFICIFVLS